MREPGALEISSTFDLEAGQRLKTCVKPFLRLLCSRILDRPHTIARNDSTQDSQRAKQQTGSISGQEQSGGGKWNSQWAAHATRPIAPDCPQKLPDCWVRSAASHNLDVDSI